MVTYTSMSIIIIGYYGDQYQYGIIIIGHNNYGDKYQYGIIDHYGDLYQYGIIS